MNIVTVILSSTVATIATDLGQLNFKPHHGQTCITFKVHFRSDYQHGQSL